MQDNDIAAALHQLVALLSRESDQTLQEQLGIGLAQYKMLIRLHSDAQPQQRKIALELGQTEASISRQVKLLQSRSLLVVSKNPNNLREHVTLLTPRGQRLIEAAQIVLAKYHQERFSKLSPKQKQHLADVLSVVH